MVAQNITLGPQETKLLFTLEENGSSTFGMDDVTSILGSGAAASRQVASRLTQKGRIRRIERGRYMLVPSRAGVLGHWAEEPWAVVPRLFDEYYVGFLTAMNYWGMTEQIPHTVFVATPKRRKNRRLEFGNQQYEFITLARKKFFGFVTEIAWNTSFNISSREKTIVDGLTHPEYCGGIPEVAKAMWNVRSEVCWSDVTRAAERTKIGVVMQRLGYLLSVMGLESHVSESITARVDSCPQQYLDPCVPKKRIESSAKYRLTVNRSREELLGWMDH